VTTDFKHTLPVVSNLLGRNFTAAGPNRVWLSDFTYIPTTEGWLYLAGLLDMYLCRVVADPQVEITSLQPLFRNYTQSFLFACVSLNRIMR
jgi:transposase InsO family protein